MPIKRLMQLGMIFIIYSACCACSQVATAPLEIHPNLPPAPTMFGQAVTVPKPKAGDDARALAARERAAILEANQRLRNDGSFYQDVLSKFSGTK